MRDESFAWTRPGRADKRRSMQFPRVAGFWAVAGWLADLASAARLLTRLPLGRGPAPGDGTAGSHPARCYPLIGAAIGAFAGLAYALAISLALPPFAAAIIALAFAILVTGGRHEDGLADVADGFGGGHDKARKLAIMSDSRIGTYGVLALALEIGRAHVRTPDTH